MPNRLSLEKSPYLRQHANNPVDWRPWGPEAIKLARKEKKPIFLSIGYSTCYWCHVMEKDSFEREEVGAALNRDFVPVKVDREEHPDVDEIYMDAVVAMTGRGGWPMSVFLTPDLKPFWGGTFIPRPQFLQLLARISEIWRENPGEIEKGGDKLLAYLREDEARAPAENLAPEALLARFEFQSDARFDAIHGGFGAAPKFPPSMALRVLLRRRTEPADRMACRTLEAMACGGIYDQLGGGFHRYSTDERWLVPHFEKMLYDNALLAIVYAEAYQRTKRGMYADTCRETLEYLLRDMRAPDGAFYAAEDAGEVGKEGEYYAWSASALEECLGDRAREFGGHFPYSTAGNFEHGANVLELASPELWESSRKGAVAECRRVLLEARRERPRPHRDEKILTSWNGLAVAAFAKAGAVLSEPRYLDAARSAAAFLRAALWDGKRLLRRYSDGEAKYSGTVSDYAYLIDGLLELQRATQEETWALWARELQRVLDREFWDENGGYFTAPRSEEFLVVRKKDSSDGAVPSPNSVSYRNLLRLAPLFLEPELEARAERLLEFLRPTLERVPVGMAEACLGVFASSVRRELVIAGSDPREISELIRNLFGEFQPELGLVRADAHSELPIAKGKRSELPVAGFLCEKGLCRAPLPPDALLQALH